MGKMFKFTEKFRGGYSSFDVDKVLYNQKSRFQNIFIGHSPSIGHFLALDNKINSSEVDYFIYHEAIVHPCMVSLQEPKRVLIIGGGEGVQVKEILKYGNIIIDWVDIDETVVKKCREFLPYALKKDLKNVNLYIQDGMKFVSETKKKYDFIMADLTEPSGKDGISNKLYSEDFAKKIKDRLTDQGMYITLCWEMEDGRWRYKLRPEYLVKTFKYVRPMHFFMPSFGSDFSLVIASKKYDPAKISKKQIREKLKRIRGSLFFYDEDTHKAIFSFTKFQKNFF